LLLVLVTLVQRERQQRAQQRQVQLGQQPELQRQVLM
jgi:hypothetical protein